MLLLSRTLKSKLGKFVHLIYMTVTLRTQITSVCNQSGQEVFRVKMACVQFT